MEMDQDYFEATLEKLVFRFGNRGLANELKSSFDIDEEGNPSIKDTRAFSEILSMPLEELHGEVVMAYLDGMASLKPINGPNIVMRILGIEPGHHLNVSPDLNVAKIISKAVMEDELFTEEADCHLCPAGFNPAKTIYLLKLLGKVASDPAESVYDADMLKRAHNSLYELADTLSPSSRSGKYTDSVPFKRLVAFYSLLCSWKSIDAARNQEYITLPTQDILYRSTRDYMLEAGIRTEYKYGSKKAGRMVVESIADAMGGSSHIDTAGPLSIILAENDIDLGLHLIRALPEAGATGTCEGDEDAKSFVAGILSIFDTHDVIAPHIWFDSLREFYNRRVVGESEPGILAPNFSKDNFHMTSFDIFEMAGTSGLGPLLYATSTLILPYLNEDLERMPPMVNQMRPSLIAMMGNLTDKDILNGKLLSPDDHLDIHSIGCALLIPEQTDVDGLTQKQFDRLFPVILGAHLMQQRLIGSTSSAEESDPISAAVDSLLYTSHSDRPKHPLSALAYDMAKRELKDTLNGDNSSESRLDRLHDRFENLSRCMPPRLKKALDIAGMGDCLEKGRRFIAASRTRCLLEKNANSSAKQLPSPNSGDGKRISRF